MIEIHHLNMSQSERIIWLMEELGLPYALKAYARDSVTMLAPPELAEVHPLGFAPVIRDGDLVLAESGAIAEYVLETYGEGRLRHAPGTPGYADYLFWFHYANGTLMPATMLGFMELQLRDTGHPLLTHFRARMDRSINLLDSRLGVSPYVAGADLTAADIMLHFPLGTMRGMFPIDLSTRPHITAWLDRIAERPAYRRAMKAAGNAV
ncbi:glutathione S-transferase family protein [Sphingomonas sp. CGMCC 1.13654]|uniref:glutathione transferase n=1 Tax=Sphingomonas chungangi TaxID=2683589 RepID=A0A838L4H0_9SPHN|nr:glutathione S-transferase family protein [Sphingomonas chungangi]MBA2933800.1 glutathione S-transferase family protein [Sphingomonas chungangi]MVW55130.1 glutathione S-transferase [Sphingomonas chungangi]